MTSPSAVRLAIIALLAALASGCEVIGGIFKAGVWTGVFLAAAIVIGLIWIIRRART